MLISYHSFGSGWSCQRRRMPRSRIWTESSRATLVRKTLPCWRKHSVMLGCLTSSVVVRLRRTMVRRSRCSRRTHGNGRDLRPPGNPGGTFRSVKRSTLARFTVYSPRPGGTDRDKHTDTVPSGRLKKPIDSRKRAAKTLLASLNAIWDRGYVGAPLVS